MNYEKATCILAISMIAAISLAQEDKWLKILGS